MQRHRTHLMVRSVEVEDPEIGDDAIHVDEPVRRIVRIDLVPADAGDYVDRVAEHPLGVVADPVAGRMVDGVARRAADTEHLSRRVLQGSECRQVLVAVAVNLVGAHDDVAPAPGQRLEHAPERHPALDRADDADGGGVGQQPGLAVGQQDVGREGQPGQPGPDRHHGRHWADHDLARVAEEFGARDGAHLGTGHGDHLDASSANFRTAAW